MSDTEAIEAVAGGWHDHECPCNNYGEPSHTSHTMAYKVRAELALKTLRDELGWISPERLEAHTDFTKPLKGGEKLFRIKPVREDKQ